MKNVFTKIIPALFIALALGAFYINFKESKYRLHFKGKVSYFETHGPNQTPLVEYDIGGTSYIHPMPSSTKKLAVGDAVDVWVNPKFPNIPVFSDKKPYTLVGILILMALGIRFMGHRFFKDER